MKLPCEIAVKSVVPAIRARLAKELIETYSVKQVKTANLLGITQTAVSKYYNNVRGSILTIDKDGEISSEVEKTARLLFNGKLDRTQLAIQICGICKSIRKKRLMCKLCQRDPSFDQTECTICQQLTC